MTRARFEQLVAEAIRTIPSRFRDELKNIAVIVEDDPPEELLDEMEIDRQTRCSACTRERR